MFCSTSRMMIFPFESLHSLEHQFLKRGSFSAPVPIRCAQTRRGASQHLIVCEAASSSSSLPSSPLYHYTLSCLQGFVAVAGPIQRLNRSGQRWPTWDEMQEEGEDAEAPQTQITLSKGVCCRVCRACWTTVCLCKAWRGSRTSSSISIFCISPFLLLCKLKKNLILSPQKRLEMLQRPMNSSWLWSPQEMLEMPQSVQFYYTTTTSGDGVTFLDKLLTLVSTNTAGKDNRSP